MLQEFTNYFERHIAPPQKSLEGNNTSFEQKKLKRDLKCRAFDAQYNATKFEQHPAIQERLTDHQQSKKKNVIKSKVESPKNNNFIDSEQLAFYFMELLEKQQDDLLVEHEIIMPDIIRKDLNKMSEFIEKIGSQFVPIEKIYTYLEKNQLDT
ncbi:MAG: hypothetical protein US25_C0014G0002 [Candidatus Moranbacteria bacterium GW2011_GWE1_36_7]|nr:MAG: hypothetical protein UR99_C0026G0006 [Candidatus Moranbacteria bacterium GW2011_GWD2_36_12]KKQ06516.1 MAG: hypothetical protein US16_C0015G0013 [Candidatus Moranbacteria bacterium GW2011_GWE2_36_40]KKQ15074.1 MAG: hypothetical protein US25_C0014G0002 [Candidatus Moranbacteria bacterium GW2011_GWE1_36_7]